MPFFFQAEDGIRDADVTGVQTCALPISVSAWSFCAFAPISACWALKYVTPMPAPVATEAVPAMATVAPVENVTPARYFTPAAMSPVIEIGRASCRVRE